MTRQGQVTKMIALFQDLMMTSVGFMGGYDKIDDQSMIAFGFTILRFILNASWINEIICDSLTKPFLKNLTLPSPN